MTSEQLQKHFHELKIALFNDLQMGEDLNLNLQAEDSLFVRFNNSMVRQNTQVEQQQLEMTYQKSHRRLVQRIDLAGDLESDLKLCRSLLKRARAEALILAEDPGATPFENRGQSAFSMDGRELDFAALLKTVTDATKGTDFTGLLASGPQIRANVNNHGQDHWFSNRSFFLDYSLFTVNDSQENKAVKSTYADKEWSADQFLSGLTFAKRQLSLMKKQSREVKPGPHRVFLAPGAVSELVQMLSWNALSYSALKNGGCAFARLAEGGAKLSPLFSLRENFTMGLNTRFNSLGEVPPEQISLIERGELKNMLISTRSAREFEKVSNYAETNSWGQEHLRSPELLGGTLDEAQALNELGTGLYLSNLHYCNWSDVQSARVTGMTRYACFWIENGEIVAPIRDLRFDESLYRAFGENLLGVTKQQHVDPNVDTYSHRGLGGKLIPGLLIQDFRFTL